MDICWDRNLHRRVCIHWVKSKSRLAIQERLSIIQTIHTPYLALIYDLVEANGRLGVVEEDLADAIQGSDADRLRNMYEFSAGVAALHAKGLAHGAIDEQCFRLGRFGRGCLCNLSFGHKELDDPSIDSESIAEYIDYLNNGSVLDAKFRHSHAQLRSRPAFTAAHVVAIRDRLAALLLRDQHRALLHWKGKNIELGANRRLTTVVHPVANVAKLTIEYDSTRFFIAMVAGEVRINNVALNAGDDLPSSCVVALGDSSRPWNQRYFLTFDQSHPEVS